MISTAFSNTAEKNIMLSQGGKKGHENIKQKTKSC
jgi:hypothetical protein